MRKRLLFFGVLFTVVALSGSVALAFDPMGPPKAQMGEGNSAWGIEYSQSKMYLHRLRNSDSSAQKKLHVDKLHKVYATYIYGINNDWDVFVRAGGMNGKMDRRPYWTQQQYDGDPGFVMGGGIKRTLARPSEDVTWGAVFQGSWGTMEGNMNTRHGGYTGDYPGDFDLDLMEFQLAVGPTWSGPCGITVYGGPMAHLVRGTLTDREDGDDRKPKSIEEKQILSFVAGAQIPVGENSMLNAEYMGNGDAWALAFGMIFKTK